MSSSKFKLGDPVWAKMKGYPPWPGWISLPPTGENRPACKKQYAGVGFFGTKDFAWIEEDKISFYEKNKIGERIRRLQKPSKFLLAALEEIESYQATLGNSSSRLSREMAHDEGSGANESGMEKRNRKRKKSDVHAETVCEVCISDQNVDKMLECYTCKARIHTHCIDPRPQELPRDDQDWACKDCQDRSRKVGREDRSGKFHRKLMEHKQTGKSSMQAESSLRAGMRNSPETNKRKISINSQPKLGGEKMKKCTVSLGRNEINSVLLHEMNLLPGKSATEMDSETENLMSQDINENDTDVEHDDLALAEKKLRDELQRFREVQERELDNFKLKKKSEMAQIIAEKEKENEEEIENFAISKEEIFKKYEESLRKQTMLAEIAVKKSKLSKEMNEKEREMRDLKAQEDSLLNDSIIVID